ncbi:phosphatase 2C-like domain-containing protein [Haematococcus lacustris]
MSNMLTDMPLRRSVSSIPAESQACPVDLQRISDPHALTSRTPGRRRASFILSPRISNDGGSTECHHKCAVLRTLDVGSHSDPGNRYAGQNQDFLVVTEMYNAGEIPRDGEQTYILAVCDGHGLLGDKSACYAGKALARNLLTSSLRNKHIGRMAPQDVMEAVKAAFAKASQAANAVYSLPPKTVDYLASPGSRCLVQYTLQDSQASVKHYRTAKGHEKLLECGTTATTVVLQGGVLCLANVGDSLAVLGVDQGPGQGLSGHFITCRHFGLNPEEAERIRQQHATTTEVLEDGYVRVVEGQWAGYELAVTRALGHLHMAQYGIIDTPFVTLLRLTHVNPCLILASDGVWDMVGADEAVAHVMASLAQGLSAGEAAKALVQLAVSRGLASPDGRQDNTSAIVVSLVDRLPIPEEAGEAEAV